MCIVRAVGQEVKGGIVTVELSGISAIQTQVEQNEAIQDELH
jgi:hypothetical protein